MWIQPTVQHKGDYSASDVACAYRPSGVAWAYRVPGCHFLVALSRNMVVSPCLRFSLLLLLDVINQVFQSSQVMQCPVA